jgi:hypothetical protein
MIKTIGRFSISVGDPPQYWIHLTIDGDIMKPILLSEEEARDLKYTMESALRHIQSRKK